MNTLTDELREKVAHKLAANPDIFSNYAVLAHRAASPFSVDTARALARAKAAEVHTLYAAVIERLEGERDELRLAICGGEDAPGYNASLSHEQILAVLRENYGSWRESSESSARLEGEKAEALDNLIDVRAERDSFERQYDFDTNDLRSRLQAAESALREIMPLVEAVGRSLDQDFGFWSSSTANDVRAAIYRPWRDASTALMKLALNPKGPRQGQLDAAVAEHVQAMTEVVVPAIQEDLEEQRRLNKGPRP